jgi:hypothetical protein
VGLNRPASDAALEIGDDAVELLPKLLTVRGDQEDRRRKRAE